jgi:hypothetical protein
MDAVEIAHGEYAAPSSFIYIVQTAYEFHG